MWQGGRAAGRQGGRAAGQQAAGRSAFGGLRRCGGRLVVLFVELIFHLILNDRFIEFNGEEI